MTTFVFALAVIAGAFVLAMRRAPLAMWAVLSAVAAAVPAFGLLTGNVSAPGGLSIGTIAAFLPAVVLGLLSIPPLRRALIVKPSFAMVRSILPRVSDTEQAALDAGTIGWDAELFSGQPDWSKLRAVAPITLTPEEKAFLEGPTEELCRMLDDWHIRHHTREVPAEVWEFVKRRGFLGMLISKEHGGLGFSAQAQSLILGKVSSRSPEIATVVMVPNSLGPGELIEKYGTPQQKERYLEPLAKGEEVPCFGLTGPMSGSDAASMRDIGVVTRGVHNGVETLGIRLNIEKRYITLAPAATIVGLAFRLFDPERLLGAHADDEIGITVALVPADTPGLEIGRRHLPAQGAWPNGPIFGRDVFIPLDWIIGGEKMVGQGWRMLMECLSAGRAISLPSSSTAGIKMMLRTSTAYARIRKQFGIEIGRMEGIEERLASLTEQAYAVEAARAVTASMVSAGEKPAVISALMKYQTTDRMRSAVNDALDIHAGKAVCDGPSNYLFGAYQMVPVGITVEGANILTRSLITFAQGALRSHPYLYAEISSAQNADRKAGLAAFETAFLSHISFALSNVAGALFHNLTGGRFAGAPGGAPQPTLRWYRQLARASRSYALVADLCVAVLGGGLKSKQRVTGRMADALSELFMLSAVLKRFEDDGGLKSDVPLLDLAAANALNRFETALAAAVDNFPVAPVRWFMRPLAFPLGRAFAPASDRSAKVAVQLALEPGAVRDRLTRDVFISNSANDPTGLLEVTLPKVLAVRDVEKRIERAVRAGDIQRFHGRDWIGQAEDKGIITGEEALEMREVEDLVQRVIAVDHFAPEALRPNYAPDPAGAPAFAAAANDPHELARPRVEAAE